MGDEGNRQGIRQTNASIVVIDMHRRYQRTLKTSFPRATSSKSDSSSSVSSHEPNHKHAARVNACNVCGGEKRIDGCVLKNTNRKQKKRCVGGRCVMEGGKRGGENIETKEKRTLHHE